MINRSDYLWVKNIPERRPLELPIELPQDEGLVADYKFYEGRGNILHDLSGYNNHGEIHYAQWVEDKYMYSLNFSECSYVYIGRRNSLKQQKFTIHTRIKGTAWTGRNEIFNWAHGGFHFCIFDGKPRLWLFLNGIWRPTDSPENISLNKWYVITGRWDGSYAKIYVNNERKVSQALSGTIYYNWGAPQIGSFGLMDGSPSCYSNFIGLINRVVMYNYAQSEKEIKKIGEILIWE